MVEVGCDGDGRGGNGKLDRHIRTSVLLLFSHLSVCLSLSLGVGEGRKGGDGNESGMGWVGGKRSVGVWGWNSWGWRGGRKMEGRGKVYNLLVNLTRSIQRDKTAICGKGHPSDSSGSDPADSLLLLKGGGGGVQSPCESRESILPGVV